MRVVVALACVGVLVSGCGYGGPTSAGGQGSGDASAGAVVPCEARCTETVAALNAALTDALTAVLPATAEVSNNLFDASGAMLGGDAVAFHPRPSETGTDTYEAVLRVRDGARAANLHVLVERYRAVPTDPLCRSEEMVADAISKGVLILACGLVTRTDGAVVVTKADDYPYDLALSARLPSRFVAVYRPDGVLVQVGIEGLVDSATPPADMTEGATVPSMLDVDQLERIATDPRITVLD